MQQQQLQTQTGGTVADGRPPAMETTKDLVEIGSNGLTAIGIVVAGVWT